MTTCTVADPQDVSRIRAGLVANPANLGVGVVDIGSGIIRLIPYDETNQWVARNPHRQVMAGHEAAAVIAGFTIPQSRGFILVVDAVSGLWQISNRSHLNLPDGNGLRMESKSFDLVVKALENAGIVNPIVFP
jgi:hypothetical protein